VGMTEGTGLRTEEFQNRFVDLDTDVKHHALDDGLLSPLEFMVHQI